MKNYPIAIEHLEKAYNKNAGHNAARGLAHANYGDRNFKRAEFWFSELDDLDRLETRDRLTYSKVLITNEKFEKAAAQIQKLDKQSLTPAQMQIAESLLLSAKGQYEYKPEDFEIEVKNLNAVNSRYSDFGATLYKDKFLFVSDRMTGRLADANPYNALKSAIDTRTGNSYLAVFDGLWFAENQYVSRVFKTAALEYDKHVGPVFENDEFLFFVQTVKYEDATDDTGYKADKRSYTIFPEIRYWKKSNNFHLDSVQVLPVSRPLIYGVSDPFWDEKKRRLYFTSNMPGGAGGTDIYFMDMLENGRWSRVQAVKEINTPGNERTPHVHPNGDLYFASDGWPGLGGLDIFKVEMTGGGWGRPQNLAAPINSNSDDFFIFFNPEDTDTGFISSDRPGGYGLDDIYTFKIVRPPSKIFLKGTLVEENSNSTIPQAPILVKDAFDELLVELESNTSGQFELPVDEGKPLTLEIKLPGYFPARFNYRFDEKTVPGQNIFVDEKFELVKLEADRVFSMDEVVFEFGAITILEETAKALDRLAELLMDNPEMAIEISHHTDAKLPKLYSQVLSEKRVEAMIDYLVEKEIQQERLQGIGYGFSMLLNECDENANCTEEQHAENRRTAYKIIKL